MTATLSAVVPTLDEERALGTTLDRLFRVADEIVVADGGSRDATLAIAEARGATVVSSARGRGAQLDAGARAARGDLLLFVHADTLVPANAGDLIRSAVDAGALGGAFRIRFDAPGWRYRLGETIA
ncbi:MAG: glycosyltransferase, partial [Myxococcota bacterium]